MAKLRGNSLLRFADKAVGVPTLWILSRLRRKRPLPTDIRSIGLLRTSCIGDTVLMAGIVKDLNERFPHAKILFFAGDGNYQIAKLIAPTAEIVRINITKPIKAIRLLRSKKVDIMIDFGPWPRIDALLAGMSKAKHILGFQTPGQHRHYLFDQAIPHSAEVHELENYRRLIEPLGPRTHSLPTFEPQGEFQPPEGPYIVFHLWPGGFMSWVREWPKERWLQLARLLTSKGYTILLTGTPADKEANEELAQEPGIANVAGQYDLLQTAHLLKGAAAVVSVNTGIMHMAAALGAPTIGLNGPTSTRRWGPIGKRATSVEPSTTGCGYLHLGFEYKGQRLDCMDHISVQAVRKALQDVAGI